MDQSRNFPANQAPRNNQTAPPKNIVDTAIAGGHFNTFAGAIQAAGLADTLAGKGPYAVFAPTDEAFKALPSGAYDALLRDSAKLMAVLNYHIVGPLHAKEVKSGEVSTLRGSTLTVAGSSSHLRVNGARVKHADLVMTNGVVHGIDVVIVPKDWELLAAAA